MGAFAGSVRKLDMKLQCLSGEEEVTVEGVLKSLKIPAGKVSNVIWDNLTAKVWNKLPNIERHAFVLEVESRESKPKTFRDFYVVLMDYFLDSQGNNGNLPAFSENEFISE
jgi:hypothetical protein